MSYTSNRVWTFARKKAGHPQQSGTFSESALRSYCENNGYKVAGHSVLDGTDREILEEIKQIAGENDVHAIVFFEKHQLSDDITNLVIALREFAFNKIRVEFVQPPHKITETELYMEEAYKEMVENPIDWDAESAKNGTPNYSQFANMLRSHINSLTEESQQLSNEMLASVESIKKDVSGFAGNYDIPKLLSVMRTQGEQLEAKWNRQSQIEMQLEIIKTCFAEAHIGF